MAGPIVLQPYKIESNENDNELYIKNTISDTQVTITDEGITKEGIAGDSAEYGLLPEGEQTGLSSDSTGVKYEGKTHQLVSEDMASGDRQVYLEVAMESSAGDETVSAELYDIDTDSQIGMVGVMGGSPRSRSGNIASELTSGNEIKIRFDVTQASETADATFSPVAARLLVR